jgi:hypothetical protein
MVRNTFQVFGPIESFINRPFTLSEIDLTQTTTRVINMMTTKELDYVHNWLAEQVVNGSCATGMYVIIFNETTLSFWSSR